MVWSSSGQQVRRPVPGEHTWACKLCGHGWNRHGWQTCQGCHKPVAQAQPPKQPRGEDPKGGGQREPVAPVRPRPWAGKPADVAAPAASAGTSTAQSLFKQLVALGVSSDIPGDLMALLRHQVSKGIDDKLEGKPAHVQLQRYQQLAAQKQRKVDAIAKSVVDTMDQITELSEKVVESKDALDLAEKEFDELEKKILACSQAAHLEVVGEQPGSAFEGLIPDDLKGKEWDEQRKKLAELAVVLGSIQKQVKEVVRPEPAAGQGKNAKKNAKKRMKKNQAEAAKAAGIQPAGRAKLVLRGAPLQVLARVNGCPLPRRLSRRPS